MAYLKTKDVVQVINGSLRIQPARFQALFGDNVVESSFDLGPE